MRYFRYTTAWQVTGERSGKVQASLRIADAAGRSLEVGSAVAQLVSDSGGVVVEETMAWDRKDERYDAKLERAPAGTYRLRALLGVEDWNVVVTGPVVELRRKSVVEEVPAGAASG